MNECDGNDSTVQYKETTGNAMRVRCHGESTWTDVNGGLED